MQLVVVAAVMPSLTLLSRSPVYKGVRMGGAIFAAVAAGGQAGVSRVLQQFKQEIDLTLAQLGCADLTMLTGEYVREAR